MAQRRRWNWWIITGVVAVILAGGLFLVQMWIRLEVRVAGDAAVHEFSGDRVHALMQLVECEGCGLKRRNRAVWALGEMADATAIPALRKYYSGTRCDHGKALCQYELDKAIRKIDGTWGVRASLERWTHGSRKP